MEEFHEENIIIDIEDDNDGSEEEGGNNEQEDNDSDENKEGNNNEEENNESDDNEGNNDEQENNNNDDNEEGNNDEQENNDNNDNEENSSENENDENNVCEEDSNNERSDVSSNNGDNENSDMEDIQRVKAETHNQQCIETRVDVECIPQAKNGPSCENRSTTWNGTPQSKNAHKKQNCKKWKGKGKSSNATDGMKVHELCHRQGHKAYKSGACRKNVASVKNPPNSKCPDASGGSLINVNSSVQQSNSNPKDKSISKGGNSQVWKNTSIDNLNKNNNSSNTNNSSSGNDNKYGSSNDSNNKGKDNKNNNFNNNNNKNNNKGNNNNYNSNKNQSNNYMNNNNNKQKGEQSTRNLLKEAKEVVNTIFKKRLCMQPLDSPILKFHYRLTVLLFVILYTIIQAGWIFKESIFCVYGNNAEVTVSYYIKNFCLTYPFVNEDQDDDQSQRRYLLFYRWTHHSFLILASLFYIPRVIAKILDNPRLKQLVHDLALGEHRYDTSKWEQDTNMMLQYMNSHASTHGYLYFWLIICHMVALAVDCAVFFYFDYMLQGHFMDLVYSAYPLHRDPQFFTDYLSRTFPPFVRCRLEKQILINNEREEELGCHLLLMDIYDKMFVVIWLWLVFLILCTTITLLALCLWVIPPFNRLFLDIRTNSKHLKETRNKIVKQYCFSDLYVLYLMKRHRSETQFSMLMSKLIHSEESYDMSSTLSKKKSKVTFKDEMMSKTDHLLESSPSSGKEQWCTKNTLHYSPIFPHDEALRSRRVDTSTPYSDYDAEISFPRNFIKHEYKV
ncbi:hypothetical protein O3P69_020796 [Scylla paramamosain]|uniref:Innexin n=1 Tax=Scylla paramamosain TaxID=85552 RepID=A0AAW0TR28_SCYPA